MEEYETVTSQSAWKWFENLRDRRLVYLAMKSFMNFIVQNIENEKSEAAKFHVFSAHEEHEYFVQL